MNVPKLSSDDIVHLARLSALKLDSEEQEKIRSQFDETLTYVDNMNELDITGISGGMHLSGTQNIFFEDGTKNDRNLTVQEATANSAKSKDGYFIVDRIL